MHMQVYKRFASLRSRAAYGSSCPPLVRPDSVSIHCSTNDPRTCPRMPHFRPPSIAPRSQAAGCLSSRKFVYTVRLSGKHRP